jgi:hypothetical protein
MTQVSINRNSVLTQGPSFPNLSTLYYFEALNWLTPELGFSDNPLLQSLGDYPKLESLTLLMLEGNTELTTLAVPSLRSLNWLSLAHNENLTRVDLNIVEELSSVELVDNVNLEAVNLGTSSGELRRLTLLDNPALAPADRQRLLDRIGPSTESSLD